ncbi:MAG: hypothetical protein ABH837_01895 [bacterium]
MKNKSTTISKLEETIDENIERLKQELKDIQIESNFERKPKLKELHLLVLETHFYFELILNTCIYVKINSEREYKKDGQLTTQLIAKIIEEMPYVKKLQTVSDFKDGVPYKKFNTINTYRNKFAHFVNEDGLELSERFFGKNPKAKERLEKLYTDLVDASKEKAKYMIKIKLKESIDKVIGRN